MMENCKTCLYHQPCPFYDEGLCDNPQSTYYEHYTTNKAHCSKWAEFVPDCGGCPYDDGEEDCIARMAADALEMLKAQEPVTPYMDYDGQDVWRCGSCGATLFHLSHTQADENEQNCVRFCRYCGKAVKWE